MKDVAQNTTEDMRKKKNTISIRHGTIKNREGKRASKRSTCGGVYGAAAVVVQFVKPQLVTLVSPGGASLSPGCLASNAAPC